MISEISQPTQITRNMVFSQTFQKPHSILKVVELDRLMCGEDPTADAGGSSAPAAMPAAPSPAPASTSFSEVYLKSEPESEESTMYHRSADCEFFQDLDLWCSAPAKEEQVQTNSIKITEDNVINTDTFNTLYQPPEWDGFDVNSPTAPASFYNCGTPLAPSPAETPRLQGKFCFPELDNKAHFQEKFLDISSLPVVIGNFNEPWHTDAHTHMKPFIDQDDSLDKKLVSVGPQEVQWAGAGAAGAGARGLRLELGAAWPTLPAMAVSTPEVLSYVEQLERQETLVPVGLDEQWPREESTYLDLESPTTSTAGAALLSSASPAPLPLRSPTSPPTPRGEDSDAASPRKRRCSVSSDESYAPYEEKKPRKYKRRKPSLPIKDMIQALEEAQPPVKARRGRPPKRRDSVASSACSEAHNDGHGKYREIRDKNNEASKRSRLNRKLKELQMEQLAIELEERNKKLQVKADILEDMTKRLKDALMSAILKQ